MTTSIDPPRPRHVEVIPVTTDGPDGGYRAAAAMGPGPMLLRRRARSPKGFIAFFVVLMITQATGAWLAQTAGTRVTLGLMAAISAIVLGGALYYGVLNATLIRIDAESLSRGDRAKGMRAFNAATPSIERVAAARGSAEARHAHFVNVHLDNGEVTRLLTCDGDKEAAFIAFKINEWLTAHRGEEG